MLRSAAGNLLGIWYLEPRVEHSACSTPQPTRGDTPTVPAQRRPHAPTSAAAPTFLPEFQSTNASIRPVPCTSWMCDPTGQATEDRRVSVNAVELWRCARRIYPQQVGTKWTDMDAISVVMSHVPGLNTCLYKTVSSCKS